MKLLRPAGPFHAEISHMRTVYENIIMVCGKQEASPHGTAQHADVYAVLMQGVSVLVHAQGQSRACSQACG
jgi:hypothetical protein